VREAWAWGAQRAGARYRSGGGSVQQEGRHCLRQGFRHLTAESIVFDANQLSGRWEPRGPESGPERGFRKRRPPVTRSPTKGPSRVRFRPGSCTGLLVMLETNDLPGKSVCSVDVDHFHGEPYGLIPRGTQKSGFAHQGLFQDIRLEIHKLRAAPAGGIGGRGGAGQWWAEAEPAAAGEPAGGRWHQANGAWLRGGLGGGMGGERALIGPDSIG